MKREIVLWLMAVMFALIPIQGIAKNYSVNYQKATFEIGRASCRERVSSPV